MAGWLRWSAGLAAMASIGLALVTTALQAATVSSGRQLPSGMVYLRQIDASIQQDIRYAGSNNFLGRPVEGYRAAECIVTRATARALAAIQRRLVRRDLSLKVYDCYRPVRAVRDFVQWARNRGDTKTKAEFYPLIAKRTLFARHYISKRSRHSHGATVDLTIVPLGSVVPAFDAGAALKACHYQQRARSPDNSLDFGTGYDCFHTRSGRGLSRRYKVARANRRILNRVMRREGFRGYHREWWHFTLRGAGKSRAMDFLIK